MNRWSMARLGDLTTVISSGATPLGGAENYMEEGPVLFIRSQNVLMNDLDISTAVYIEEAFDRQLARTRVAPGDVLLNITGASIGRVTTFLLKSVRANVNQHVCVIRPRPQMLFGPFLSRYIATPEFQTHINRIQAGGTRQALNFSQIAEFDVPLPPLVEQRQIAAILDRADALRQERRFALQKLDSLTRSLFLDNFGDPVTNPKGLRRVSFSSLLESIDSGNSPICLDRPADKDEWAVLKLGAVTKCEFDEREQKALPDGVKPTPGLEVKAGDLLFSRKNTRDLVAACALVANVRSRLMLPDLIFRFALRHNAPILKEFLHQLLIFPTKRREIQKLAGGSAGSMPNISKQNLLRVQIELPPIELQTHFAKQVKAIQSLKVQMKESIASQDTAFHSLQHRAFRGEL